MSKPSKLDVSWVAQHATEAAYLIEQLQSSVAELEVQKEWVRAVWEASEFSALDSSFEEQFAAAMKEGE